MKIRKSQWSSLQDITKDMLDCLTKLDRFASDYTEDEIPKRYKDLVKEGFKSYVESFYQLTKDFLMIATVNNQITWKTKNIEEYFSLCESNNLLPENGALFCEALRILRNEHAHGYEKPTFEEVLEFYKENSEMFLLIYNKVSDIKDKEFAENSRCTRLRLK